MLTKAEAALIYASWGWSVIPVLENAKLPATSHGVHDATTDVERIKRWWEQNPNYNIGIAAGERSGICVFDVDPRNGGDDSWGKWTQENGAPDDCATQLTAGGGYHFIAQYDPEIRSCKLVDGVDFLSDGRYFLAYPSTIENRQYEWEASSDPFDGIAPLIIPKQWKAKYLELKQTRTTSVNTSGGLIQGGRNDGLTALAGAMRHYGMTEAEIYAAVSIANETRCEIPLPASEIKQIVRSVSRYEPDCDIAANAALGSEAANALLDGMAIPSEEYRFTRATSFLSQPSPLAWVIKEWVPEGITMVYGESGVGKTFFTMDMACSIASGKQWHGKKTKEGFVVYMNGEGQYGIRQRVASWCKHNGVSSLDNLVISNKAIDLDNPLAASQIIRAVKELTDGDAVAIFIDTLNNHMSGDENSAKDTRNMVNCANTVASALNASVVINHHMGHNKDANGRARGSSAWKASLDSSIMLTKAEENIIEINCTKMKDAEQPIKLHGQLEQVDLGWVDEDGDEIRGAVFQLVNNYTAPPKKENDNVSKWKKYIIDAWFFSGAEVKDGVPFVTESAFKHYLETEIGMSAASVRQNFKKSGGTSRGINILESSGTTRFDDHGIYVTDNLLISNMMMRKNG